MDTTDLINRFEYHKPDAEKAETHAAIRERCLMLAEQLNECLPEGREKSLAITHLEEVMMWSNAAIARN